MSFMFYEASAFNQDLGWCLNNSVNLDRAFQDTPCESTSCGVKQGTLDANGVFVCQSDKRNEKEEQVGVIVGAITAAVVLLTVGALYYTRSQQVAKPESPTELSPPEEVTTPKEATSPESLETRAQAAAKAKAAETAERPGFTRKLSSFLFGEQEEEPTALTVAEAEEAPSAEQPPPPPARRTEPEPAAPKAEAMYNQIAAWYSASENAALRETWGAYPEPEDFQTWPGFVAVTNAFLDREAG